MDERTALEALIEAVEAGTATGSPDAYVVPLEMSRLIETALGDDDEHWADLVGAHDGSLDDALALHNALLPGWEFRVHTNTDAGWANVWHPEKDEVFDSWSCAAMPSRAWLLAILRALAATRTDTPPGAAG